MTKVEKWGRGAGRWVTGEVGYPHWGRWPTGGGWLDDLCSWYLYLCLSQHPNSRETGYSNVLPSLRPVGYWGGRETGCRPPPLCRQDSTTPFFFGTSLSFVSESTSDFGRILDMCWVYSIFGLCLKLCEIIEDVWFENILDFSFWLGIIQCLDVVWFMMKIRKIYVRYLSYILHIFWCLVVWENLICAQSWDRRCSSKSK